MKKVSNKISRVCAILIPMSLFMTFGFVSCIAQGLDIDQESSNVDGLQTMDGNGIISTKYGDPVEYGKSLDPSCATDDRYSIGTGIYDITGPIYGTNMMGYVSLGQQSTGIRMRLWSRAFIFKSWCNNKRVVYVTAELQSISEEVRRRVIQKLKDRYGSSLYTDQNVMITATHQHSGPGGYHLYPMYNAPYFRQDRKNIEAIADGIYKSIFRAQANLTAGTAKFAHGSLNNFGINRSQTAYNNNPDADPNNMTDKDMQLLKLETRDGKEVGMLNWHALHPTVMPAENTIINPDVKGYAAKAFESLKGADYGPTSFVAGFANSNGGDVSHGSGWYNDNRDWLE